MFAGGKFHGPGLFCEIASTNSSEIFNTGSTVKKKKSMKSVKIGTEANGN